MKSFILAIACSLLAASGFAEDVAKPVVPTTRIDFFNGKDFTGWKFVLRGDTDPAKTWAVTNGVIHCTGRPFGYARTERAYANYKLTAEWRFVTIAPKADNSGIFVHINPPDKVWPTCIEAQGQHNRQGDLRMNGGATSKGHDTADTKNADAQGASNEKPAGEWNTFVIECSGDSIKLWTNGRLMNQITGCSVSSGAIGIQAEGGEIEVRKIFVEPLPDGNGPETQK